MKGPAGAAYLYEPTSSQRIFAVVGIHTRIRLDALATFPVGASLRKCQAGLTARGQSRQDC
jgi:hypothetical protein